MRRFAYRLALAMGVLDVDAMLASMPSSMLAEWRAFEMLEPFGHPAAESRHVSACLAATGGRVRAEVFAHKPPLRLPRRYLSGREVAAALGVKGRP